MSFQIRPASPADYEAIAAAGQAAFTDAHGQRAYPFSAEQMRKDDAAYDPKCRLGRWVAEQDGQVVGLGQYDQAAHRYNPHRFWMDLYVHPAYQGRGIGRALYEQVIGAVQAFDPTIVRTQTREDFTRGVRFCQDRGWQEAKRLWESDLDLTGFDLARFGDREAPLRAQGITIHTLPELAGDPDRDRKLYELIWEIRQAVPELDPPTKEPFEFYVERRLHDPDVIPEAYFVAVHDGQYVGDLHHRRLPDRPGVLSIANIGVTRAYRGRGIAWALKLRGLAYALAHGYRAIYTSNESRNTPILSINRQLGFVRRPAWIDFIKVFRAEETQQGG